MYITGRDKLAYWACTFVFKYASDNIVLLVLIIGLIPCLRKIFHYTSAVCGQQECHFSILGWSDATQLHGTDEPRVMANLTSDACIRVHFFFGCSFWMKYWYLWVGVGLEGRDTLHHTATHCNTLQHTVPHCNVLRNTATHCHTLPHTATHCNTSNRYTVLIWRKEFLKPGCGF